MLQGLSFIVEPGTKCALVGPTGCSKSSCFALLQRLYEPSVGLGEILIDDVPLEEYDLQYLRQRIVIVDQATVLFNDTIRSNIAYGTDATDEDVVEALKAAKAWEFVDEMPDKIWSVLSEGGDNLSGGQRQRLAIARAMVRKPDVILLDEATSALDNKSEAMVQEALDQLSKQGSSLVIAHRLSTIKDSDKIVVIDNGQKVEEGTHSELMAGELGTEDCEITYEKLWNSAMGSKEVMTSEQLNEEIIRMKRLIAGYEQKLVDAIE